MTERDDYSGDFDPNFRLDDLSKDALHRLSMANAKCYIMMARLWYDLVRERFGDGTARELDLEIWGQRALPLESNWVCEALNIRGNDVATLFKLFQTQPGFAGAGFEIEYDLKNAKHGVCTVNRCLGLEYFERKGMMDIAMQMCEEIEPVGFSAAAHLFDPDMIVIPIKLPTRQTPNPKPHCIWEYRVPQKAA